MKRTKEDRLRERGELKEYIRSNRKVFIFWSVLRLIVILAMIRSAMLGMWDNVFICLLTLVLFMLPLFIRRRFGIELPSTMQMIIIFHIFACEILGELSCYYVKYEYWDTIMHTAWGFLCAALGLFFGGYSQPRQQASFQSLPRLCGDNGVLLFNDDRRAVGVL